MSDELDYRAMYESLFERFKKASEVQDEYFKLLKVVSKLTIYQKVLSKHISEMSMVDQLAVLKMTFQSSTLAKHLCEKYGWDIPEGN